MRSDRFVLWLFIALAFLQLVPIWSTRYLPTSDGPEHLYNSWILHGLVTGHASPLIRSHYAIDWRPNPNWLGHIIMALLMAIVPPLIAEKILFSAIVLLFLAGAWIFAGAGDPRSHVYAFLAFPFAFHQLLQDGFYNFSLSLALWMIVVGWWWRRRDDPSPWTITTTATLLILCYFSHPMSVTLAIGSIGLLWLCTLRGRPWRSHARHLLAIIPAGLLLAWFASRQSETVLSDRKSLASLIRFLADGLILFSFDWWQLKAGRVVFAIFVVTAILTIFRRRRGEGNGFLLLFVCFLTIYLWSPSAFAGGTLLTERMALFVMLALLPWFTMDSRLEAVVVTAMSVLAILGSVYYTTRFRASDRYTRTFLASLNSVGPNTTLLPLMFDRNAPNAFVGYISHATAYVALQKRLVDLDNYEPATGYFPLKYAEGVDTPSVVNNEASPEKVDVSPYTSRARFLFAWKMPDTSPLIDRIESNYRLVSRTAEARVYESRVSLTNFQHPAFVLLPLSGTLHDAGVGVRWSVDQELINRGAKPVLVALNTCSLTPCELDIGSRQSVRIAGDDPAQPFVLVRTEREVAAQLDASTILRRTDSDGDGFHVALPVVRENDFRAGSLKFRDIPFSPASRLNLRMWVMNGGGRVGYSVTVLKNGRELARRSFGTGELGFVVDSNFDGQFPEIDRDELRVDLVIEPENVPPTARSWAFITATDNRTNIPALIYAADR